MLFVDDLFFQETPPPPLGPNTDECNNACIYCTSLFRCSASSLVASHASHEWVLEKTAVLWVLSNLKILKGSASRLHHTFKGKSNPGGHTSAVRGCGIQQLEM